MNKQLRPFLLLLLGLVTTWDTFTTITGTTAVIGTGNIQILLAVIFGGIISSFLIFTIPILENSKGDIIPMAAKFVWFLALCYDLYTSFTGNLALMGDETAIRSIEKIGIAVGMTIFVSSCPIGISYIFYKVPPV